MVEITRTSMNESTSASLSTHSPCSTAVFGHQTNCIPNPCLDRVGRGVRRCCLFFDCWIGSGASESAFAVVLMNGARTGIPLASFYTPLRVSSIPRPCRTKVISRYLPRRPTTCAKSSNSMNSSNTKRASKWQIRFSRSSRNTERHMHSRD